MTLCKVGNHLIPDNWSPHGEAWKSFRARLHSGFFDQYMSGDVILDVGYSGEDRNAVPVLPHAIGVDLDYPGYDGRTLPFGDGTVDSVFSSHVLEHVDDPLHTIRDWYRVLKTGGFIVCIVPHQYLYERRRELPSNWAEGWHKRFYTPGRLLSDFETALEPNTYRVRLCRDNDSEYDYSAPLTAHPTGAYEMEAVIEKIRSIREAAQDCRHRLGKCGGGFSDSSSPVPLRATASG